MTIYTLTENQKLLAPISEETFYSKKSYLIQYL